MSGKYLPQLHMKLIDFNSPVYNAKSKNISFTEMKHLELCT